MTLFDKNLIIPSFVDHVALWAGSASDGCVFPVGLKFIAASGEG